MAHEYLGSLRRRGIETVILAGADTHGIMRGKRLPIAELDRAAQRGIALCDVVWALPVDEVEPVQPPPGHAGYFPRAGYPDMIAVPDLETARVVPWHDHTALLLCDFVSRDGSAIPLAPRAVLRSVVERARSMGFEPIVGVELEFYVLRETPQSVQAKRPSQLEAVEARPSVYGVVAASRQEPFAGTVRETLLRYGLPVEACNPEAGPGQFEINLRAAPALHAADEAFLLKNAVKEIAARQGLLATFMAKPRSDWPGSSCHLHLSLGDEDGMSSTMRQFIGGLLAGMAELSALFAPTPNSYRRFVPHSWAGTTATWGVDNRSAGLRAICRGDGATRVEHRQSGADANPYLAVSAALAAGLDGLQRGCEPAPPIDGDVYALVDGAVRPLPATLGEATAMLERSALARDWLGDDVVEHYVAMRRAELAGQAVAVTDWETSRYLEAL
ncbi:MAG TPA: glutamine synthetase family protein [Solirubrobacteraceae bacterium]|nr:glutamine synthetase family protein [Solirubrobacteraceae bacterium]